MFVIQTQGQKHWRVFSPPPPSRMPKADPLARGKSKDKLELTEMSSPLLDIVLTAGQVLYVPAGFPHTTGACMSSHLSYSHKISFVQYSMIRSCDLIIRCYYPSFLVLSPSQIPLTWKVAILQYILRLE